MSKKSSTFAPAFEKKTTGAVVQLVRIPACHAVGREFVRGMPLPAEAGFPD